MHRSSFAPLRLLATLVLAAAAAAACHPEPSATPTDTAATAAVGAPATTSPDAPPSGAGEGDDLFACTVDADCEVIEMGACDACNGGWLLAVHRGRGDEAKARHAEPTSGPVGCTKRGCDWSPTPVCDAGQCARMMDLDMDPATPMTKVENFSEGRGRP